MEIWVDCPSWPGIYEVSNLSNIRRTGNAANKKQTVATVGYLVVGLWHKNRGRVCYVHALVAEAFHGPIPKGWSVNHKNGNKLDNSVGNLEYVTLAENARHAWTTGLCPDNRGEKNHRAKLTDVQAAEIRRRSLAGERTTDLAREFAVGLSIISQIKHGSRRSHAFAAEKAAASFTS